MGLVHNFFRYIWQVLTKEYNHLDFPFYNDNPGLSPLAWIVILFLIPIGLLFSAFFSEFGISDVLSDFFMVLIIIIPLLYFVDWDTSLFIHRPTRDEIVLAVLMFIAYMVYAIIMGEVLSVIGVVSAESGTDEFITFNIIFTLIYSIMFEELFKFLPSMFLMTVFYKLSRHRQLSLTIATVIVITVFAAVHMLNGLPLIYVLCVQGLGSIFEVYGYVKTKNLLVPYFSHLLTDLFIVSVYLLLA